MMLRVRRAAVTSIAARSSSAGRSRVRSVRSSFQVALTPMLVSTSRSRFTSSIRAMPRRTVLPRLIRLPQSRATAAFLLERTSIEPDSLVPPSMRKFIVPEVAGVISGDSRASAMRLIMSRLRFWLPASMRVMALWEVFSTSASWICVRPRCLRASRIRRPMEAGVVSVTRSRVTHT